MKKALMLFVALAFVFATVSVASASKCEFHQWKMARCHKAPAAKPAPVVKEEKIVLKGVNFDTGSAKIKKESYAILDDNIAKIKDRKCSIAVVGYTDNRGSEKMNLKLSEARANSVKDYMISKGIAADRLSAMGKGPADPIGDNATDAGRAENRRIELEMK